MKRAEEIQPEDLKGREVDLFTSFQMVEHLHDPAIFFRRLSKKSECNKILITVPYRRRSRVAIHYVRNKQKEKMYAEDVHIFELSPGDWEVLFSHAGWRIKKSEIYYQYPRSIPVFSNLLRWYWANNDYEGFWGVLLEKDTTYSDLYMDWEN